MKKNQIIIAIIAVAVLILAGIVGWALVQKSKVLPNGGTTTTGEEEEEEVTPVFSLLATVSSVDAENNFLMVKPLKQETQIKVILSDTTKLVKLEFPFDPQNPPEGATFTPVKTDITISGFEPGDQVFIKAKENIAGKTEFNNVDFIHIMP